MLDARIFIEDLKEIEETLLKEEAVFKGDYAITDNIYVSKDPDQTLDKVFLRLRVISKNIWDEQPIQVVIKNTELKTIGKQSVIPFKRGFDSEIEAKKFVDENYLDKFNFSFKFFRTGRQYFVGKDVIDLEEVEGGYYTIELKSPTEEGLIKLLRLFNIKNEEVIKGPSVVAISKLFTNH